MKSIIDDTASIKKRLKELEEETRIRIGGAPIVANTQPLPHTPEEFVVYNYYDGVSP